MLFCTLQYQCSLRELLYGSVNEVINSFVFKSTDELMFSSANLLLELLMVRDGMFEFPSEMFARDELQCMIEHICTC